MTFMPFGMHKGAPLYQIPRHYLEWCLSTIELRPDLRGAIESELAYRDSKKEQEINESIRADGEWLESRGCGGCKNCDKESRRFLKRILKSCGVKLATIDLSKADIQISEAS